MDNLDSLSARELDAVVAKEIMGLAWTRAYSTNPAASYELRQEMRRSGWTISIDIRISVCQVTVHRGPESEDPTGYADATDELRAIAIASVRAVRANIRSQLAAKAPDVVTLDCKSQVAACISPMVDEHGECPNCGNPPHEGGCTRKVLGK